MRPDQDFLAVLELVFLFHPPVLDERAVGAAEVAYARFHAHGFHHGVLAADGGVVEYDVARRFAADARIAQFQIYFADDFALESNDELAHTDRFPPVFRPLTPNFTRCGTIINGARHRRPTAPAERLGERIGRRPHLMGINKEGTVMETAFAEHTAPISDEELARRIGQGDKGGFEALMRQHNRRLYRVARAILNDDGDAEDALQEAYLAAYQRIGTFQGKSKLSTWLTRIVINAALQRLRTNKRHGAVIPLAGVNRDEENEVMTTTAGAKPETPERAAMRTEMRR